MDLVKTTRREMADNADLKNRRVIYIVSSSPPPVSSGMPSNIDGRNYRENFYILFDETCSKKLSKDRCLS